MEVKMTKTGLRRGAWSVFAEYGQDVVGKEQLWCRSRVALVLVASDAL